MSGGTMKAIVRYTYGSPDVLRLEDVARPTAGEADVLVRVHAASANAGDWHLMRGTPFPFRLVAGLFKPKHPIIGTDIAGRVESVGRRVTQFKAGDDVFGELSRCGFGGYAEYVAAPETALALKPSNASFEQAAATPTSGLTALQALRKGKIQPGQKVLIHGAAGGVGTFAVQVAKSFGTEVTAVCGPGSVDMVRAIGADRVLDYTREDFRGQRRPLDLGLPSCAQPERLLRHERRFEQTTATCPALRTIALVGHSEVRKPADATEPGGFAVPQRSHRNRQGRTRDRPSPCFARGAGSDPLCGTRPRSRKGRCHSVDRISGQVSTRCPARSSPAAITRERPAGGRRDTTCGNRSDLNAPSSDRRRIRPRPRRRPSR
jgi:hypothetical protein